MKITGLLLVSFCLLKAQVPRPVEEFPTGNGVLKITPVRHASLMLEASGAVVHVDPWSQGNDEGLPAADLILMNLPYTMPPDEAADAVKAFRPRIDYPYHDRESDTAVFEKALAGTGIEVRRRNWYY